MVDSSREFQRISDEFKRTGDFKRMYRDYAKISKAVWEDTARYDYQADLWYYLNCNDICLEMLGARCIEKRVLSIGGGFWVEKQFLDSICAKEIVRTDLIPDEGVIEADAANLPFKDGEFDIVVCRELIEHVPDAEKVYAEIKRVLKPQGYLLITTPNAYAISIDGTFHLRGYTPVTFLKELGEQGFEIIAKRGNVPYAFHGLRVYLQAGCNEALEDFKEIDRLTKDDENRYYLGTQLFVLARKTLVKEGS